jgi:hemerythrin superfamily protein
MAQKPNLYVLDHKGQRARLFELSVKAGRLNNANQWVLDGFSDALHSVQRNLLLHAQGEEKFIHPLLADRVPGGAEKLDEEHRTMEHLLENLVSHADRILMKPIAPEERQELGLEFYLAFNRFISFYLGHIDEEEEYVQPTLWHFCSDDELRIAWGKTLASMTPAQSLENLEMTIPATTIDELAVSFSQMKDSAPPELLKTVVELVEGLLSPDDWAAIKSRVDIA